MRTRNDSACRSSAGWSTSLRTLPLPGLTEGEIVLGQGDSDGAPAPGEGVRLGREPEVDRRALDAGPDIGGDCVSVARNGQSRTERDDRRIDGCDAVADRHPGRR